MQKEPKTIIPLNICSAFIFRFTTAIIKKSRGKKDNTKCINPGQCIILKNQGEIPNNARNNIRAFCKPPVFFSLRFKMRSPIAPTKKMNTESPT